MAVEPVLARKLRAAGLRAVRAHEQRDELVREAIKAGGSLREVAALVGLSHQAVKFIAHGRG